jgi:hypothetical protein
MQTPTSMLVQKYEYLVTYQNAEHYFIRSEGRHHLADAVTDAKEHISDGGHARISRRFYGTNGMQYREMKGVL